MFNKTYEELYGEEKAKELKEQRRLSGLKRKHSQKTIKKMKKRIFSKEHRKKISDSKKGKAISEITINKIKKTKSNSYLNNNVDQTLYKFYHEDGRIVYLRKYDMKKIYKCNSIHKLIKGI